MKEVLYMATNNRTLIPEARYGLDQFKLEIASEVGITNYETIDKGNLTSRQNGTVGGNMVKKMVESYERGIAGTTSGTTVGRTFR
jgi:hypothetical protein